MNYIAVDDEPFALKDLEEALHEAVPDAVLHSFNTPSKALDYAGSTLVNVAFLDIELGSVSGLVLAKKLKDLRPEVHIIFVTSHEQYAVKAFELHATGYLMKPATAEDIRRELTFLYGETSQKKRVRVQTFGGFDVFVDGVPLEFKRAKSKELLAYLIDRRGVSATAAAACAALWGDASIEAGKKNYFRTIVKGLREALKEAGIEHILLRSWNSLAIIPEQLDCDSYHFLDGDPQAVNSYRHDYLTDYEWAEFRMD
ncbi:response regulator [Zongyangia hominis]|uniref:Stage 0 sporulation protein A homolog n=1 Tax=Zongyangia hominis TaxID=2763677 RepID=A0A926EDP5_9FIRM|nr:response regulator [Zongyangia hominis]MBC8570294.1 response regulator [Zongyangia hominis]